MPSQIRSSCTVIDRNASGKLLVVANALHVSPMPRRERHRARRVPTQHQRDPARSRATCR